MAISTIATSGGDYVDLNDWSTNLLGTGNLSGDETAQCEGFEDDTTVDFDCNTNGNTLTIELDSGTTHHAGDPNTSGIFKMKPPGARDMWQIDGAVDILRVRDIVWDDITREHIECLGNTPIGTVDWVFERCIFDESAGSGGFAQLNDDSSDGGNIVFANCIFIAATAGSTEAAILNNGSAKVSCYNCTFYEHGTNSGRNVIASNQTGGQTVIKNCIIEKNSTSGAVLFDDLDETGSVHLISDNAEDSSWNGMAAADKKASTSATFTNAASQILTLSDSDTAAEGWGDDLSGDSVYSFSDDIAKTTRTNWSSGAHDGEQSADTSATEQPYDRSETPLMMPAEAVPY